MMWRKLCLVLITAIVLTAAPPDERPAYTQDLQLFKTDKQKIRLQMLVGCWLMTREYMPLGNQQEKLMLVKVCMKHITRKDSVVKITSLIGKNMTSTKTYQEIVPISQIPQVGQFSQLEYSEFDRYLLSMLKNYEQDLSKVEGEEGRQLKKKVQEQVQKRTKYYFGVIPANQWTHFLMLLALSLILVMFCTCYKYFRLRNSKKDEHKTHKHSQNCKHPEQILKDLKDLRGSPKKTK